MIDKKTHIHGDWSPERNFAMLVRNGGIEKMYEIYHSNKGHEEFDKAMSDDNHFFKTNLYSNSYDSPEERIKTLESLISLGMDIRNKDDLNRNELIISIMLLCIGQVILILI